MFPAARQRQERRRLCPEAVAELVLGHRAELLETDRAGQPQHVPPEVHRDLERLVAVVTSGSRVGHTKVGRSIFGCIEADFFKQILLLKDFSRSTRFIAARSGEKRQAFFLLPKNNFGRAQHQSQNLKQRGEIGKGALDALRRV